MIEDVSRVDLIKSDKVEGFDWRRLRVVSDNPSPPLEIPYKRRILEVQLSSNKHRIKGGPLTIIEFLLIWCTKNYLSSLSVASFFNFSLVFFSYLGSWSIQSECFSYKDLEFSMNYPSYLSILGKFVNMINVWLIPRLSYWTSQYDHEYMVCTNI